MLNLRILRIDLPFGREVVDCDIQEILRDNDKQKFLQNALLEHGLLLFRSQTLSPQEEVRLAELFPHDNKCSFLDKAGPYPFQPNAIRWTLPSYPIRIQGTATIVNHYGVRDGELKTNILTREWHTDGLHDVPSTTLPPVYTSMYCYRTPKRGGETLFASGRVAYENLVAAGLAARAQRITIDYDLTPRAMVPDGTRASEHDIKSPTEKKWNWPAIIKDRCGRPSLYLAPCFTQTVHENEIPLSTEDGQQLLSSFLSTAIPYVPTEGPLPHSRVNFFAHRWQPGDILVWDNRQMLHSATPSAMYEGEERMFHRIRMSSREPIIPYVGTTPTAAHSTACTAAEGTSLKECANPDKLRVAHKRKCELEAP